MVLPNLSLTGPVTAYEDTTFVVEGYLTDPNSGAGLAGQTIQVFLDAALVLTVVTASNGRYQASLNIHNPGQYVVRTYYAGGSMGMGRTLGP